MILLLCIILEIILEKITNKNKQIVMGFWMLELFLIGEPRRFPNLGLYIPAGSIVQKLILPKILARVCRLNLFTLPKIGPTYVSYGFPTNEKALLPHQELHY